MLPVGQFTYISLDDFRIVYDQLLGKGTRTTEDRVNIPYSVFMTPVLSRIGLTEAQARAQAGYSGGDTAGRRDSACARC